MFFCDPCRKAKGWPESLIGSYGKCEVCGEVASCHDVHHSQLPEPKEPSEPRMRTGHLRLVPPPTTPVTPATPLGKRGRK